MAKLLMEKRSLFIWGMQSTTIDVARLNVDIYFHQFFFPIVFTLKNFLPGLRFEPGFEPALFSLEGSVTIDLYAFIFCVKY